MDLAKKALRSAVVDCRHTGTEMPPKPKPTTKGKTTASAPVAAAPAAAANPLRELVSHLLHQAELSVLGAKKVPVAEKHQKAVEALETVLRNMMKDSRQAEMQRVAIMMVMQLQINAGIAAPECRKIIGTMFTYLIHELHRHWREYGLVESDVHPDFHNEGIDEFADIPEPKEDIRLPFAIYDIDRKEQENWQKAFKFLQS